MKRKVLIILGVLVVISILAFGGSRISKIITGNAPAYSPSSSNGIQAGSASSKTVGSSDSAGSANVKDIEKNGNLEKPVGNETHSICLNEACVGVPGEGINECYYDWECRNSNSTHLGCVNNSCAFVPGNGTNECDYSGQFCGNQNNTHLECLRSSCVEVSGNGTNECSANKDCLVIQKNFVETFTDWFKGIFGG